MAFILNATPKEKSVCAQGKWFTFKPEQMKQIDNENLALFFSSNLAYEGLVRISDLFEDPDYRNTEAGKLAFQEAKEKGIENRVGFLKYILNNELVSLKSDMQRDNDQSDPANYMSKAMVANMEELAEYKKKLNEKKKEQVSQIHKLKELIDG